MSKKKSARPDQDENADDSVAAVAPAVAPPPVEPEPQAVVAPLPAVVETQGAENAPKAFAFVVVEDGIYAKDGRMFSLRAGIRLEAPHYDMPSIIRASKSGLLKIREAE